MRVARQALTISAGISLVLHVLPFFWLVASRFHVPLRIPIEVRVVTATMPLPAAEPAPLAPPPPPATSEPPPRKPDKAARSGISVGRPKPKKVAPRPEPPPAPPPPTQDLRSFAPGTSRMVVLLRTDRIRRSPHRDAVSKLLERLPDYHTLLGGTGLTPVGSFDALLIATANPFDVTASFIAARHADDGAIHRALSRRRMPPGDPRRIHTPLPTLSVVAPALLELAWHSGLPGAMPIGVPGTHADAGVNVDGGSPMPTVSALLERWSTQLRRFDHSTDEPVDVPGGVAVLVTLQDLGALIRLPSDVPVPLLVGLAMTADASPAVRLRLELRDEADAQRMAALWPRLVEDYRSATRLFGLGALLDGLTLAHDGTVVEVTGRLNSILVERAVALAQVFLPPPPVEAPEAPEETDDRAPPPDELAPRDAAWVLDPSVVADMAATEVKPPSALPPRSTSLPGLAPSPSPPGSHPTKDAGQ